MTTIVVIVAADDSLREAARRMTDVGVGAAVVVDGGRMRGIITERDLLHSVGRGEAIDEERVGDHLAPVLIYAHAAWPLERAAEKMSAAGARHVIVTGRAGDAIGILSMRDIVRCWIDGGFPAEALPQND